jgi:hypothetical protein
MYRACDTHEQDGKFMQNFSLETEGRGHLGDAGVDGRS